MHRAATAVMVLVTLAVVGCTDGDDDDAAPRPTLTCESIPFTPNSEDLASDVRATGLSCDEAEAVVAAAGRRTSSGGPPQVTVNGFRCVLVDQQDDPLPRATYECTDDDRRVTFVRT